MNPRYSNHNYCSTCGQDEGWYPKEIKNCPIHHYKLRTKTRLTRCKPEDRWLKAI